MPSIQTARDALRLPGARTRAALAKTLASTRQAGAGLAVLPRWWAKAAATVHVPPRLLLSLVATPVLAAVFAGWMAPVVFGAQITAAPRVAGAVTGLLLGLLWSVWLALRPVLGPLTTPVVSACVGAAFLTLAMVPSQCPTRSPIAVDGRCTWGEGLGTAVPMAAAVVFLVAVAAASAWALRLTVRLYRLASRGVRWAFGPAAQDGARPSATSRPAAVAPSRRKPTRRKPTRH